MPNELPEGTRRTGDLFDAYPNTPEVKVTLERTGMGIGVTIAWSNPDVPYADWFLRDGGYIKGTEPQESLPVPRRVLFQDSHGSALLIRCWARGYHANAFGPGSGTLWAKAAILGVERDVEFERPHGLQTDISGLRHWLGVTSWIEKLDDSAPPGITIQSKKMPAIQIGEFAGVELRLHPTWQYIPERSRDRSILLDVVHCVTRSSDGLDWDDHLNLHRAIRDLLVLSRWRDESCVPVRALRTDDPLVTLDNKKHGDQWRAVVVSDDAHTAPPDVWQRHLIEYAELGPDGLAHWIRLREEFARALDPVISSIDLGETTPHTRLAHTGPGLEALGYLLLLRDDTSEGAARGATLRARFDRILEDVGDSLPFSGHEWRERTVAAYNGLKHANRREPDELDVMQAWAESVMVTRAWAALEVGVPAHVVKARLEQDRQPREFVRIE